MIPGFGGHPSVGYGTTLTSSVKAARAAPATSGAFASAMTLAVPPRVPAHRSEARTVPSASTRQPDATTKAGAALCTAVHRRSSTRGLRTSDTTVPGRTHNRRTGASPGETVTCACPATQLPADAVDEGAGGDPVGAPAPGGAVEDGAGTGVVELCVGAPLDGCAERAADGPALDPVPVDALQAARTTIPATAHPAPHPRMPTPPRPPGRPPGCSHTPPYGRTGRAPSPSLDLRGPVRPA